MARFNHFEQMYDDPDAAAKFYEQVFGWKSEVWKGGEQPYWMITTGKDPEPGINGGFMKTMPGAPRVINTVTVDNLDEATKKAEAAGGKVTVPKMTIPGVGYQAYFADPGGVIFGIHQSDESAK